MFGRALVGVALSVTMFSADVAVARDWGRWGGHSGRYDRHHRGNGVDAGDILLGAGIIAGIAVLASAANRDKERRERTDGWPPRDDRYPDSRYPENRYPDDRYGSRDADGRDEAVDLCSAEAEREGEKYSSRVRINRIEDVRREADGRFAVNGIVDIDRSGYDSRRDRNDDWRNVERTSFACTADRGRIVSFRFGSSAELAHRY